MSVFSIQADTGDIEVVMRQVGEAVRRWEGGDTLPLDLAWVQRREERLLQQARQLRFQAIVDGNAIIHSTRPRIGPWIIRFQHFIRKITWWFLEPILQQIRTFQLSTAQIVEALAANQETLLAELQRIAPPSADAERASSSTSSDIEA